LFSPKLIQDQIKKLAEGEAAVALREAWKTYLGQYPSDDSLALLWAQSALETGRWKIIHCYNFGNIKKRHAHPRYKNIQDDGHDWCMFRCNEVIGGVIHWFDPPHPQTHFRAYASAHNGAKDYIKFLANRSRYKKAWSEVVKGDPAAYSHELKKAGYYTASESLYTRGVVRLTNEFKRKKDKLLLWTPDGTEPDSEQPQEGSRPEHFLTEEEKKEIMVLVGLTMQESVDEYFNRSDRFDDDFDIV
jgi:hypothetical protein